MNAAAPTAPPPAPAPTGFGLGIGPDGTYTLGAQVLAFFCGLWTMIVCVPLLFVGAILYSNAEEKFATDPAKGRRMVLWSWLSVTVLPIPGVLVIGAVFYAVKTLMN